MRMNNILILGIGNTLFRDDGVGIRTLEALGKRESEWPGVRCLDGGTLSFTLAPEVENADRLIVIDAARFGEQSGKIRCFLNEEMDRYLRSSANSVHEVSLSDLLDMARLRERLPRERALIAIQVDDTAWGEHLSTPVAAAIPEATCRAVELIERWTRTVESANP
ncbi:MAG: hydrogenase maturation protease [Gammaproteobacteria bacterium]|nr:hydrogenase maturation protease [Gammaproteobacteria bacterium]